MSIEFASWPNFSAQEAQAAHDVIASNLVNYWTGQEGRAFEKEYARWADTSYAIALTNGTVALDLALKALDIGAGDEVVVTPRTFIASVSSIISVGAKPIFADVDIDSGNITPATIANVLTHKTKAIIAVHLAGWPCDMDGIMNLAKAHNLAVIEDCAQAHGAKIGDRPVGSIGDVGAWSFCQDKIMTTGGEGGMVTTNNPSLWDKMWSYKDHGKSWDAVYNRQHPEGFRWLHESFGTNWRMLEVQAAIGRIQLNQMEKWTQQRSHNANAIRDSLSLFGDIVRIPRPNTNLTHAYYRQYAYVNESALADGWNRDRIVAAISAQGYPAFQGTCSEVYLEKAFEGTDLRPDQRLPVAKKLGKTSVMFLTHPNITSEQLTGYCEAIKRAFEKALR